MALSTIFRSTCCLVLLTATTSAQNPFGGADPFGGGNVADPFGGRANAGKNQATADPFAGGGKKDPRAAKPAADPGQRSKATAKKDDLNPTSPEDRIRRALDQSTTQSFVELPLSDVVQQLSQSHNIPIVIDLRSLEEIGLSAEEPVSISLRNVSLRSFLRLTLRSLDLTYIIQDEVMQITTPEAAERHLVVQAYRIPDGLVGKAEQIVKALTATVTPEMWTGQGGPCAVSVVDSLLVVSANETGHEAVDDFLKKLKAALEQKR